MKRDGASISLYAFAGYLGFLALTLSFVPNFLLKVFSVAPTSEPWIRVVGLLCAVLAYYYLRVIKTGFREFYMWTVHTRIFVLPFFAALVFSKIAPPVLLLFGAFEFAMTLWTFLALRSEAGANT